MSIIPVLETERLVLRGHRADDLKPTFEMWQEPAVILHVGNKARTEQEIWTKILSHVGHWNLLGFGYWAIEEKSTRKLIGEIGFADIKRGVDAMAGLPEIGWALKSSAHGKGYAFEAVLQVVEWGDLCFHWKKTACMIAPKNVASIRVAEKAGYKKATSTTYYNEPILIFERKLK